MTKPLAVSYGPSGISSLVFPARARWALYLTLRWRSRPLLMMQVFGMRQSTLMTSSLSCSRAAKNSKTPTSSSITSPRSASSQCQRPNNSTSTRLRSLANLTSSAVVSASLLTYSAPSDNSRLSRSITWSTSTLSLPSSHLMSILSDRRSTILCSTTKMTLLTEISSSSMLMSAVLRTSLPFTSTATSRTLSTLRTHFASSANSVPSCTVITCRTLS